MPFNLLLRAREIDLRKLNKHEIDLDRMLPVRHSVTDGGAAKRRQSVLYQNG